MEKKYELVKDDSIIIGSSWLYRIRALKKHTNICFRHKIWRFGRICRK